MSRRKGKPVWLDDTQWRTIWLVTAHPMKRKYEPEYVRVVRVENGWRGIIVGTSREQLWHDAIWREATEEETRTFNERYGIESKPVNDSRKEVG